VQLGFVIDHSRCIGCHACTVACKSENEVPLGDFRTWVKNTEEGQFPEVKRSFAVLRCNQCTNAPCVEICPVTALDKRTDGIVDIDSSVCIGCKSCMHGCPYDALYINEATGTAEKCHFCAHRTERGLAPACAIVCPTEAIIPGDFHDPSSRVSRLKREHELEARKVEAGTSPNVFYREAAATGLDPSLTNLAQGTIWSELPQGPNIDAQVFEALEKKAQARTVYDVPRKQLWGNKITGYLFAKSLAAGIFPAAWYALGRADADRPGVLIPLLALVALALTGALLIGDLKRPDRFYLILTRPNWDSWLARGTYIIVAYSALLVLWMLLALFGVTGRGGFSVLLGGVTCVAAALTGAYTGWLFMQAKGRVLWMKRGYWLQLIFDALLAGSAFLLVAGAALGLPGGAVSGLKELLVIGLVSHLAFIALESKLAPAGREAEYERAARLVSHGPYAKKHWRLGVIAGGILPLVLLTLGAPPVFAALLALVGLWIEEDILVRAGQALPIS